LVGNANQLRAESLGLFVRQRHVGDESAFLESCLALRVAWVVVQASGSVRRPDLRSATVICSQV
jgi:hypothetical protein